MAKNKDIIETLTNKTRELSDNDLSKVSGGVGVSEDDEIKRRVISIIREQLDLNHILVTPETRLVGDLGADSMDLVDLTQALEEEFKIVIYEDLFSSLVKVQDIIDYISNKVNCL